MRRRSGRRATTSMGSGFIRSAATWTRPARRSPRSCAQATPGRTPPADHFAVLALALEQLPARDLDREILVRADSGGATHAFCADCRDAAIRFSVGYELNDSVRAAIVELPETAWVPAIDADGQAREGAWVAELTAGLDLSAWPQGARLICPPRAPAPRRAVSDLRRARPPAHVLSHRPRRPRHRRTGAAPPRSRARRGQHPRRQGHRHAQPAPPRLRAQPDVARALADRPRPRLLDEAALPRRPARQGRTQTAAPPTPARRRTDRPPRTPHPPAPASGLALGPGTRPGVRTDASDPRAL